MSTTWATEEERRRLHEEFAQLCAIRSIFGEERAVADHVIGELRALGLEPEEDDTAAESGAGAGNVLVRIPGAGEHTVLLCAHLDTVPHEGTVAPVFEDGAWVSAGDTILGADNKAAVAGLLAVARRFAPATGAAPPPVAIELLLTTSEENALAGAKAFDVSKLQASFGLLFDHATPIGEVITASPTYYRLEARFRGRAAHAGLHPEQGRSAILAAARAITSLPHGRLDAETTANVGGIRGGTAGTNIVPERCTLLAETRSLDPAKVEAVVAQMVDAFHDAANEPVCACDLDVDVERLFEGYRLAADALPVRVAEAALRARGHSPRQVASGGGSDANALIRAGLPCVNLANGTEHAHEDRERVTGTALEEMLDVTYALIDESARLLGETA